MITRHSKKRSFNFLFELLGSLLIRSSQEDYPRFFSNKTQTILYFLLSRIIPILLLRFLESSACIIRNSSKDSYTRNRPLYDTCSYLFREKKRMFLDWRQSHTRSRNRILLKSSPSTPLLSNRAVAKR